MIDELYKRRAAIQAQVERYAPIRGVFEEFLKGGQRVDELVLWCLDPDRRSRYNWERQEIITIPGDTREVVVKALTDSSDDRFGHKAGDLKRALITVNVSLPKSPTVARELELPPVWALLGQNSDFSPLDLDRLAKDLEEIVPLVRALLPQS